MTLPLELGKFQICVVRGCNRDAAQQVVTKEGSPIQYYLGVCNSAEHLQQVERVAKSLDTTPNPVALLEVDKEQVFVRPEGRDTKCKLVHFRTTESPEPERQPCTKSMPALNLVSSACPEWEWEARPDRWMTLAGKSVKLSALPNGEFVSSCLEILRVNYKRVTSTTKWVRQLVMPRVPCTYDADKLDVGTSEAGWKLAEFKQEAINRGLL